MYMKRMLITGVSVLSIAALSSSAFAATANTAKKGSLLVFTKINIHDDVITPEETLVRIANDYPGDVNVKCYYLNATKFRVDFRFWLTHDQPFWFDARTGQGTKKVPPFPTGTGYFFDPVTGKTPSGVENPTQVGDLKCWAVDAPGANQISWNHLSGTATVYNASEGTAYEYNAWAFRAYGDHGTPVGDPGHLALDGHTYDDCPEWLIGQFSPTGTPDVSGQAIFGASITGEGETTLSVATCKQDLRQDFTDHYTKLQFDVFNEEETKFTGAYQCIDSFWEGDLEGVFAGTQFSRATLGTNSAKYRVRGIKSAQCDAIGPTEPTGLLASQVVDIFFPNYGFEAEAGTTLSYSGHLDDGSIWWDTQEIPKKQ